MKSTTLFQLAILVIATAFSFLSCKKETTLPGGSNTPPIPSNRPPVADAGKDRSIILTGAGDSVNLDGSLSNDPDGKTINFLWRQISGASVSIANPQTAKATAKNLLLGIYQFELKVTDNGGLSSTDTMMVTVKATTVTVTTPPSGPMTSPYYANNLTWIFPWYSTLEVSNIFSFVPQGTPLKVFVQRDYDSTWVEVQPISFSSNTNTYEYFIETRWDGAGIYNYGSLYVFYYGPEPSDTPNVKVEF